MTKRLSSESLVAPTQLHFIHGLNSSHHSFAYIASELGADAKIDYISHQELNASIAQVLKQLPKHDEPITLVGHSLGGLIGTLIALNKTHNVQRVVTISSPLGGSRAAVYARWVVSGLKVLHDITPGSPQIVRLATEKCECPILSIISTGGSLPTSTEPNDSVVTVASQKALAYAKKVEIKANHFEVLMHARAVEAIRKFTLTAE
jgi:hypothetical protein